MSNNIDLSIEKWCAWAPGVEKRQDWEAWARGECNIMEQGTPDVTFVAPMLRRRLSQLSRMALYVANGCLEPQQSVATVFCSRHGELHRTVELLQSIAEQELLSPMGFSLSVPNTGSGLYSISRKDTSVSTVLSAGIDSFEQSFLEAAAVIKNEEEKKVLLVCCDMPLPSIFSRFKDKTECLYGLAILLSGTGSGDKFNLSFSGNNGNAVTSGMRPLLFLKYLLSSNKYLAMHSNRLSWQFKRYVD